MIGAMHSRPKPNASNVAHVRMLITFVALALVFLSVSVHWNVMSMPGAMIILLNASATKVLMAMGKLVILVTF